MRAALADKLIPDMNPGPTFGKWDIASTEEATDHWHRILRGSSTKSARELTEYIETTLSSSAHWTLVKNGTSGPSEWRFKGKNGETWKGNVQVQEVTAGSRHFLVTVDIAKVG